MAIWIGTSGYTYPEWRGSFYPEKFPAGRMLGYYAERFPTVEINYTFYRTPSARTVAGWAAGTPEAFRFALKAPRRITHERRLKDVADPLGYFLDTARGLGTRLGPVLFQLPPTFRQDVDRLAGLLALWPADLRAAFEFRHDSWFAPEVYARLRERNAALCVADTEQGTTPAVATADWGYLRLRDLDYTDDRLQAWGRSVRAQDGWRETFIYFKHEESGTGPLLAGRLRGMLGA
jgi:uncharacterized protein YecE (DUF72 family)